MELNTKRKKKPPVKSTFRPSSISHTNLTRRFTSRLVRKFFFWKEIFWNNIWLSVWHVYKLTNIISPTQDLQTYSAEICDSDLSEKALISQRSSSSSATQVSITTGPVCLAGSGFLGRKALDRRPFLCGVWVSGRKMNKWLTTICNYIWYWTETEPM